MIERPEGTILSDGHQKLLGEGDPTHLLCVPLIKDKGGAPPDCLVSGGRVREGRRAQSEGFK